MGNIFFVSVLAIPHVARKNNHRREGTADYQCYNTTVGSLPPSEYHNTLSVVGCVPFFSDQCLFGNVVQHVDFDLFTEIMLDDYIP